ncbi:C40 family peptidase [Clostridium sp.]|uniref:C40 family peptidase n=1 Tax=Clostridium sp. TaxID=1506 RepID=UPI00399119CB
MINIKLTNSSGTMDITELIEKVVWSGSYKDCARKLEFSYISNLSDKNIPIINLNTGDMIRFLENNKELFRGYVVSRGKTSSANNIPIACFDAGIYINKNEAFYNFKGQTPEGATKKICSDFGISAGTIATTNITFDKKFFGVKLYEIIMTAYSIAAAKNSKKYMCVMREGKLNVIEKGVITLSLSFSNGANIIESDYSEDILDMVNKVLVLDDTGKEIAKVENSEEIKKFGSFQKILKAEEGKDNKQLAQQELKGINQTASITGFGDSTCTSGNAVKIHDNYTGLTGLFYIDEDIHTWDKGMYTIKLNLAFKNIMDEKNAGEEDKPAGNSTSSSNTSNNSSNTGKAAQVIAEARKHLGKKYVWGATGPNTFDCSGLMVYCFKKVGVSLPRTTWEQIKKGSNVSKSNLKDGDLVFFNTDGSGTASHVGLYIGGGNMIHAPNSKTVVKIESINSSYYSKRYLGARRVI